jgi:hypothetical protein
MIRDLLILALFTFLSAWSIPELMKLRRTGVIDDGGDWDWHPDEQPGFTLHGLLLVIPIFGFITALIVVLVDVFS